MMCPTCGGDNREGARFCRHCGLAIEPEALMPSSGMDASAATPSRPPPETRLEASAGAPAEPLAETGLEASAGAPTEPAPETEAEASAGAHAEPASDAGLDVPAATLPLETRVGASASTSSAAAGEEASAEAPAVPGLTPNVPGTVIDGRYLILNIVEQQDGFIRYAARDLCRCWQCGFDANSPDDAFCAQCGASLPGGKSVVSLLQVLNPEAELPEGETLAARLNEGDAHFLVLGPRPTEPVPPAVPAAGLRLFLGQATHPGQVRPLNEDSLLSLVLSGSSLRTQPGESMGRPLQLGLFAVADGMGGHEGGEVASKLALHIFGTEVVRTLLSAAVEGRGVPSGDVAGLLARAVEAANDAVYLSRQKRETDMGTTLTAALVLDGRATLAHVGDSRALRWSTAGLEQLTADHSLIASLVAAGRAAPDEVYTHPQRSVVLRSIGDRATVEVDTVEVGLLAGDRLVLCSDGLWEMLRNDGIADVLMQESEPQAAAELLVARANAAGGDDNIAVVVVQVA